MNIGTGAAAIFGTTGGVMEAALRCPTQPAPLCCVRVSPQQSTQCARAASCSTCTHPSRTCPLQDCVRGDHWREARRAAAARGVPLLAGRARARAHGMAHGMAWRIHTLAPSLMQPLGKRSPPLPDQSEGNPGNHTPSAGLTANPWEQVRGLEGVREATVTIKPDPKGPLGELLKEVSPGPGLGLSGRAG